MHGRLQSRPVPACAADADVRTVHHQRHGRGCRFEALRAALTSHGQGSQAVAGAAGVGPGEDVIWCGHGVVSHLAGRHRFSTIRAFKPQAGTDAGALYTWRASAGGRSLSAVRTVWMGR